MDNQGLDIVRRTPDRLARGESTWHMIDRRPTATGMLRATSSVHGPQPQETPDRLRPRTPWQAIPGTRATKQFLRKSTAHHHEPWYYNTFSPIRPCTKAPLWASPCSPTLHPLSVGASVPFCQPPLRAVPRCPVPAGWTLSWPGGRPSSDRGGVQLGLFFWAPR